MMAARGQHEEVMEWCVENGCPHNEEECERSADLGNLSHDHLMETFKAHGFGDL